MRSEYSREQLLEQKSIHYLLGKCINLNWKYRQYDQDNDVDGEIEIFEEEKEILKYIAKSKYIKVQLKAQKKVEINKGHIKYSCKTKFLEFVKECDVPLILVIYDENTSEGYWLFLQEYISENLKEKDLKQKTKDIKIPLENTLENNIKFKDEMIKISEEGILEILLANKKIDLKKCYEITKTKDISTADKVRKIVYVYINGIFLKSEKILEKLLERILEPHKINNLNLCSEKKYVDELTIFIYDSLKNIEVSSALYKFELINNKEKKIEKLNEYTLEIEEIDKGAYIRFISPTIQKLNKLSLKLCEAKNIKDDILKYEDEIKKETEKIFYFNKDVPFECIKLSSKVMGYAIELDNFKYYKENNYNNYYISKRLEDLKKICIEVTNLLVEQLESMKI